MGQITSLFVRKVAGIAGKGVDVEELLRPLGLDVSSPVDPSVMVEASDYYDFLERLAEVDPHPHTIPLRAGASMRCDDYGALGLAWKSAPNLRASYERAERYARVLTSVAAYEVEPTKDGAFLHLHRAGERRLGMRLSNEATLASIVTISQEASTRRFQPIAIHLKHSAPSRVSEHETFFGCPVHFDTERDALEVSSGALAVPNRLGDESIVRFLDRHLEGEVSKFHDEPTLDEKVRRHLALSLSEGVPTLTEVGNALGMSARTLQRRLSEMEYSFQELVDTSRRELANHLLKDSEYSLAEVAFMTGFSEQSAFTRAFKRWSGQTPRSYRLSFF